VGGTAAIGSWWAGTDRVYVTADGQGHPTGIVRADVVATVPREEWATVPASAVSVSAPAGWVNHFTEMPSLADVLMAMGRSQLDVMLVAHEGQPLGIVFGADAMRVVE